jgi:hypothetical protein
MSQDSGFWIQDSRTGVWHGLIESIPLAESYLCVSCECIVRVSSGGCCTVCGSESVLKLAVVLGPRAERSAAEPCPEKEQEKRSLAVSENDS